MAARLLSVQQILDLHLVFVVHRVRFLVPTVEWADIVILIFISLSTILFITVVAIIAV